jgi:ABC-type transport system involved in multi-copper enzyme maturation permease subunit
MSTGTITPNRPQQRTGRDGFRQLLHAEWTKFRTVRGWVIGMAVAGLVTVLLGLLAAMATHSYCDAPPGQTCGASGPVGPNGEPVSDNFFFVHQSLAGDGSITARVTALSGIITYPQSDPNAIVSGVEPWTRAGIIIKDNTNQGSPYAAVMVTGGHGVRMQYDYTHDTAGRPGAVTAASPRWLRLARSGDTLTGYESSDGARWTTVGTATLTGLATTVQVGLFVASPGDVQIGQGTGSGFATHFTQASAVFDEVGLHGAASGTWRGDAIGGAGQTDWERYHRASGFAQSGGRFTVTGSGDIAPDLGPRRGIERTLLGAFAGLIAVIVVATLFITSEYRRPLIRTTLAASPRRGQVLAAKAVVIGSVTFVAGLLATALAVPLAGRILRANGVRISPVTTLTELRVMVGTAALLAVAAVLALALGAITRRSAAAVTVVIVTVILPYVLAVASAVPAGAAQWLLRVTPAAAFAIQQSRVQYPQVTGAYTPANGYFPLAPWAGFAVLCGYAALALAVAAYRLRRRDA